MQSAVNAADGKAVYFPKGTYKLGNGTATNTLTIGGDRTVHFAPGAVLKPQTNTSITIDCPIEAERNRIFDLSGGGAIKFAQKAPRTVYPEWWGAVVGGTVNCSPAIQAAVNAITDDSTGARGGEIVFSAGEYQVLDTITLPRGYYKPKLVLRGVDTYSTALHAPTGYAGQEVTLIFGDSLTTIQSNANIKLTATFTSTPNDTLKLIFDGSVWRELSRSVLP